MFGGWLAILFVLAFGFCAPVALGAEEEEVPPAKLKISGAGLWDNRQLKRMLHLLDETLGERTTFDANYLGDTTLLILSELRREGYLEAQLRLLVRLEDGTEMVFMTDEEGLLTLPRPMRATWAQYRIDQGVRYFYDKIEFSGLEAISRKDALRYFVGTDFLLQWKGLRIFTPGRLEQAVNSLLGALRLRGFQEARVKVADETRDPKTGAVSLNIQIEEGPPHLVRSVVREVVKPDSGQPAQVETNRFSTPYSEVWAQDYAQTLRQEQYRQGYPDTSVDLEIVNQETVNGRVEVDLRAVVNTGPRIRLGAVRFEGNERTREWLLRRRSELDPGEWLNRIQAEEARFRLARMGVFDSVKLSYDETGADTRDVIYDLDEGRIIEVSLLAGFGSYELLRGGFEVERRNIFGLAQRARLRAAQSFKSTSANLLYTAPVLIGRDVNLFFDGSYLMREEVSFTRLEYGGSAGVQRYFAAIRSDASLRYTYEVLNAEDAPVGSVEGEEETTVSSITLSLKHDRRDNPLYPRRGYQLFGEVEYASPMLAGAADYVRVKANGSLHFDVGGGRFIHLGLEHGVAMKLSSASTALPFNKRFFPGGENSVRGYQFGEASPRDAAGDEVGAESFLLGNIEFEQALTPSWSVVTFVDGVGLAESVNDYPGTEILWSAGGGIRWKTIVGPVRLEYGHNLNPRRNDPSGTVHFSIGFPF